MNISKKRIVMNAFFKSQFCDYPLALMCNSRASHNKINLLYEHCLRIIYSNKMSSFETVLERDGFVPFHNRNLQLLAIEIYKARPISDMYNSAI